MKTFLSDWGCAAGLISVFVFLTTVFAWHENVAGAVLFGCMSAFLMLLVVYDVKMNFKEE